MDFQATFGLLDENPIIFGGIRYSISKYEEFDLNPVFFTESLEDCYESISRLSPNVLVSEVYWRGRWGLDYIYGIRSKFPNLPIIVFTNVSCELVFQSLNFAGVSSIVKKTEPVFRLLDQIKQASVDGIPNPLNNRYGWRESENIPLQLSSRERNILLLLMEGFSNKNISEIECISPHTVDFHRRKLFEKFDSPNVANLVKKAMSLF